MGHSVSGHGPDADQISDGERDWTVPLAVTCFAIGYVAVTLLTLRLAATSATAPATASAVGWSLLLAGGVGGVAIAVGSGRAAIWAALLPGNLRATAASCRAVLRAVLLVSFVTLLVAFLLDAATAVNVLSELQLSGGEMTLFALLTLLVLPNATCSRPPTCSARASWSAPRHWCRPRWSSPGRCPRSRCWPRCPTAVRCPAGPWAWSRSRPSRRRSAPRSPSGAVPTVRWEEGALRGCAGGVLAGVVLGVFASVAGGAVGPGRMRVVEPLVFDVLVHAITALGIGGLLGGLVMTWWQRRTFERADPRTD